MSWQDILNGVLSTGTNYYLQNQDIGRTENLGKEYFDTALDIGQRGYEDTQFEPFTVTSSLGSGSFGSGGGSITTAPEHLQGQEYLRDITGDFAGRIGDSNFVYDRANPLISSMGTYGDPGSADPRLASLFNMLNLGGRTGDPDYDGMLAKLGIGDTVGKNTGTFEDILSRMNPGTSRDEARIYEMLEGMQQPGRDRGRLELENRLFGQGRTGVSTSAYGGTPEQLAMEKAIQESKSGNAFNAYRLAADEAYKNRALSADEVAKSFGLSLQERGQDISQKDLFGRLALGGLDAALGERGQNIGENINLSKLGLDAFSGALNERGQNIGLQDLYAQQALNAYRTALGEQGQLGELAGMFGELSFMPDDMLLRQLALGTDVAEIGQKGDFVGSELFQNAALGGLDVVTAFERMAVNARGQRDAGIGGLFTGDGQDGPGLFDLLAEFLKPEEEEG